MVCHKSVECLQINTFYFQKREKKSEQFFREFAKFLPRISESSSLQSIFMQYISKKDLFIFPPSPFASYKTQFSLHYKLAIIESNFTHMWIPFQFHRKEWYILWYWKLKQKYFKNTFPLPQRRVFSIKYSSFFDQSIDSLLNLQIFQCIHSSIHQLVNSNIHAYTHKTSYILTHI